MYILSQIFFKKITLEWKTRHIGREGEKMRDQTIDLAKDLGSKGAAKLEKHALIGWTLKYRILMCSKKHVWTTSQEMGVKWVFYLTVVWTDVDV